MDASTPSVATTRRTVKKPPDEILQSFTRKGITIQVSPRRAAFSPSGCFLRRFHRMVFVHETRRTAVFQHSSAARREFTVSVLDVQ